jgi:Fic family protein
MGMKAITPSTKFRFLDNLDEDLQQNILNQLRILWTYSSNAIEGNSLSLGDTKFIIEEGLTIAGKSIKEHNEVMGHVKAIDLIYSILDKEMISEEELFLLHKAIQIQEVYDVYKPVGDWKKEINGTNIVVDGELKYKEYPHPNDIKYLMGLWFQKFRQFSESKNLDELIELYAAMHLSFVSIHPFFDGNGRIARLISNYHLLKSGFPPITISIEKRKEYLKILSSYQNSIEDLNSKTQEIIVLGNKYFNGFVEFCKKEYIPIQKIIKIARKIQEKRKTEKIEEEN